MYRTCLFQRQAFNESLTGYALFEDVEFSSRAKSFGSLVVDPSARLDHLRSAAGRLNARAYARMSVVNRHRFARQHRPGIRAAMAYWWSVLGLVGLQSAQVVHDHGHLNREQWRGTCDGIADVVADRCGVEHP